MKGLVIAFVLTLATSALSKPRCPSGQNIEGWNSKDLLYPHRDCDKYYICVHGAAIERMCPIGLHYNAKSKQCDWPENANCPRNKPIVGQSRTDEKIIIYFPEEDNQIVESEKVEVVSGTDDDNSDIVQVVYETDNAANQDDDFDVVQVVNGDHDEPDDKVEINSFEENSGEVEAVEVVEGNNDAANQDDDFDDVQVVNGDHDKPDDSEVQAVEVVEGNNDESNQQDYFDNVEVVNGQDNEVHDEDETNANQDENDEVVNGTNDVNDEDQNDDASEGIVDIEAEDDFGISFLENGCPVSFDVHWLLSHETDCNKFYICNFGQKIESQCASTLFFNPSLQVCDYPDNSGCQQFRSLNKHRLGQY